MRRPATGRKNLLRHNLIVARMNPDHARRVADLFAASDATELPHLAGASARELFHFHGLYFHLVESSDGLSKDLAHVRDNPFFKELGGQLSEYISPYDPATWRGPRDAMATSFYRWQAGSRDDCAG
jgi:cyclase